MAKARHKKWSIPIFLTIPDICNFFSTGNIFGSNFLHTIARKSRQTDFATKRRKSQNTKKCTYNEGDFRFLHTCHVKKFEITPHVDKFQISPHLSCEINPHVEKFEISPHLSCTEIWNVSTWQIFSPRAPPVVPVTNIRYEELLSEVIKKNVYWHKCSKFQKVTVYII